ncbi:hypothetical protein QN277_009010 [Acacia crassicarpa]|uniref:Uncharacterized protein n=1 Tax=Acacia crassicarpa TaxID=499986 RepID=A0AAE1IT13_9FABA|nr:hypothetical protein QN277_009001 [Acacia crassicarpa]KAK4256097.1 hypothetical protein QN277_009010 [Acacia crassicarpa]
MFGLEGELEDPLRSGWQLAFVNREKNDVLLLGDGPWPNALLQLRSEEWFHCRPLYNEPNRLMKLQGLPYTDNKAKEKLFSNHRELQGRAVSHQLCCV